MRCNPKMMMAIVTAVFVFFGCAGERPRPQAPEAQTFDSQKYLTAEASGNTQGEAKRSALAALASIFQSRVRAETLSRANAYLTADANEQFEKQVEQMVQVQTDVHLEGAHIGWVRPDEKLGGFNALAVLDKKQAADRWRNELHRIQTDIQAATVALETVKGRLPRLVVLNQMAVLTAEMAQIESRLSVLGRPAMPYDQDLAAIFAERLSLIQEAGLFIQIEGEAAEAFRHRLGAQLTAQGYQLASSAFVAAGLIHGNISIQQLALDNPDVKFVRAIADMTIVDQDTNTQIAALSENVRKGHMDENEAQRRAIDQLAKVTAEKIFQALATMGVVSADPTDDLN